MSLSLTTPAINPSNLSTETTMIVEEANKLARAIELFNLCQSGPKELFEALFVEGKQSTTDVSSYKI